MAKDPEPEQSKMTNLEGVDEVEESKLATV